MIQEAEEILNFSEDILKLKISSLTIFMFISIITWGSSCKFLYTRKAAVLENVTIKLCNYNALLDSNCTTVHCETVWRKLIT